MTDKMTASDRPFLSCIHIKNGEIRWKQGRTKLIFVPVLVSGILAELTKYWEPDHTPIAFDERVTFWL